MNKVVLVPVFSQSQNYKCFWLASTAVRKFKWTRKITQTLANKHVRIRRFIHRNVRYEILWDI